MRSNKRKIRVRAARAHRIRTKIAATASRPRLSVFRSLRHLSGQIIGPGGTVLVAVYDTQIADNKLKGTARAKATGMLLAEKALQKEITMVVFDKGHYKYHGRVRAFAEGAREKGLSL
jgi:large subunit ribosomal protein L18